ncbi:MAG: recombinase family protein [Dokdonella sp.]
MAHQKRFIGYYRVSTKAQSASGLGEDAQRRAVREFAARESAELVGEYVEVESGGSNSRPVLREALRLCQSTRAVLVIARLDRLARNVFFVSNLMESRVEFIATDMPSATKLTLHLIAAIAEHERDLISQRTKAALREAKLRGVRLGNPSLELVRPLGLATAVANANQFASSLRDEMTRLGADGPKSLTALAKALNDKGIPTRRGRWWTAQAVKNLQAQLRR